MSNKLDLSLIKSGDILGVSRKTFHLIPYSIQKLTHSKFNHVGLIVEEEGKLFVIEAMNGIVKTPIEFYSEDTKNYDLVVKRVNPIFYIDEKEYKESISVAIERAYIDIGKGYDFFAIAGLALKCVFKPIFRNFEWSKKYTMFQSKDRLFCSEAISEWFYGTNSRMKHLFIGEKDMNATPQTSTPKDVMKAKVMGDVTGDFELK